jgi:hypothetical protein
MVRQWFSISKETSPDGMLQAGLSWLVENEYDVLKVENEAKYTGYVGEHTVRYEEGAHFIARKDGHQYAVFVGLELPTDEELCTRYFPLYVILDVDGLIFLNLMDEAVSHVDFKISRSRRYHFRKFIFRGMWFAGGVLFTFSWLHRT